MMIESEELVNKMIECIPYIIWPHIIEPMRGSVQSVEGFSRQIQQKMRVLHQGGEQVALAHSSLEHSCVGEVTNIITTQLSVLQEATCAMKEELHTVTGACTCYAHKIKVLNNKYAQLEHERHGIITQALHTIVTAWKSPALFVTDCMHYECAKSDFQIKNDDFSYALCSAEDEFMDALGLEQFPDPSTGKYSNIRTAVDRDRTHRAELMSELDYYRNKKTLNHQEQKILNNLEKIWQQLERIDKQISPAKALLYAYDAHAFHGDGTIMVGIGDVDHARHVAFTIPGITSEISSVDTSIGDALHLYQEVYHRNPRASYAGMVCLGYDAPSGKGIISQTITAAHARTGGLAIAHDIDEFAMMRHYEGTGHGSNPESNKLHLSLIGHSYGSSTVAYAGLDGRLMGKVDDFVMIGSPGSGAMRHASEFGVEDNHVHIGRDKADIVSYVGSQLAHNPHGMLTPNNLVSRISHTVGWGLGADPYSPDFGGEHFDASNHNHSVMNMHAPISAHVGYYDPDSTSIHAMGDIVAPHLGYDPDNSPSTLHE